MNIAAYGKKAEGRIKGGTERVKRGRGKGREGEGRGGEARQGKG